MLPPYQAHFEDEETEPSCVESVAESHGTEVATTDFDSGLSDISIVASRVAHGAGGKF